MTDAQTVKAQSQARFGQFAQGYVDSARHAEDGDLHVIFDWAHPQSDWLMMDIATGGGHTAKFFAPHVRHVVAFDLTPKMLIAARKFLNSNGLQNISYAAGDAEQLPFPDNTFDLITCRIAPHHFPDCFRFTQEAARALKPGGLFLLIDNTVPDDERAARYVDSFERLRDPSHNRMYAPYEWAGMFLDAGLTVEQQQTFGKPAAPFMTWAVRQGCSPEVIEKLQILLLQAPPIAREWLNPHAAGTEDATFDQYYALVMGRKPSA